MFRRVAKVFCFVFLHCKTSYHLIKISSNFLSNIHDCLNFINKACPLKMKLLFSFNYLNRNILKETSTEFDRTGFCLTL